MSRTKPTPDQSITAITLTLDQIAVSPNNRRRNRVAITSTEGLEHSILKSSLWNRVKVHPMRNPGRGSPKYGTFDGQRRFRAIGNLIKRGDLPADWPISCLLYEGYSDAELVELSVLDPMMKVDFLDFEIYAGIAAAHRMGISVAKLVEDSGQTLTWVKQAIRLGMLAKPVFAALESGAIGVDQAKAYAATEDTALQLATFEQLRGRQPFEHTPAAIHAAMRVGDREEARLLRFVGDDAYRDAGGRFELDLFADAPETAEHRGRVEDSGLLRTLVQDKLADLRDTTRAETQRPDLRFILERPRGEFGIDMPDSNLQVHHEAGELSTPPDADVVGHIEIPESGNPVVTFWWASRAAKWGRPAAQGSAPATASRTTPRQGDLAPPAPGAALSVAASAEPRRTADAAIADGHGLTAEGIQSLRSLRRAILRAALVADARGGGDLARDLFVWGQLRSVLGPRHQLGMRTIERSDADNQDGRELVATTAAGKVWGEAVRDMALQPFVGMVDPVASLRAFVSATRETKDTAAAIVAGFVLERSLAAGGYDVAVHDVVGHALELDDAENLRSWCEPSAELLDLLPNAQRLAIAEPFVDRVTFAPWSRLKSHDLTRHVLAALTGTAAGIRDSARAAALTWVHPLLRFGDDAAPDAAADAIDTAPASPELENAA